MLSLRRAAVGLLTAVLMVTILTTPTQAAPAECAGVAFVTGSVKVDCSVRSGGGGGVSGDGDGGVRVCSFRGEVIPCVSELGVWDGSCYFRVEDPQPPPHPLYPGYTYVWCAVPGKGGPWLEAGVYQVGYWREYVPGFDAPSAREVADRAVAQMQLRAGLIGLTPFPDAQGRVLGTVGVPTYLWIADPGESTTGPITRTATGGAITVTATATLDKVVWTMGDGATVTCDGPGTAYRAAFGAAPSPDCGHTYQRTSVREVGGAYTITATSHWTVHWTGGGQSGTIALTFDRSIQHQVGEIQVIITNR